MLDASSMGSFMNKKIDAKWELIERIQCNTEDWEIDNGKESVINYEYDCIKSFVETESFNKLSAKFGFDSQILVDLYKSFAPHLNMPKRIGPSIMNLLKRFAKKMKLLMLIAIDMIQFQKMKFYISMLIFVECIDLVKGL